MEKVCIVFNFQISRVVRIFGTDRDAHDSNFDTGSLEPCRSFRVMLSLYSGNSTPVLGFSSSMPDVIDAAAEQHPVRVVPDNIGVNASHHIFRGIAADFRRIRVSLQCEVLSNRRGPDSHSHRVFQLTN